MRFDMFFQILWTFEALATEPACMRFERHMYANMRGNVIPFHGDCVAIIPCTGETQIIARFAADMCFADMIVESFWIRMVLVAVSPLARKLRIAAICRLNHMKPNKLLESDLWL